jgi:hypothetical protein
MASMCRVPWNLGGGPRASGWAHLLIYYSYRRSFLFRHALISAVRERGLPRPGGAALAGSARAFRTATLIAIRAAEFMDRSRMVPRVKRDR